MCKTRGGKGGKGRGHGDALLDDAVQRMEVGGSEDHLDIAKSIRALMRAELTSHEALSHRVGELETALTAANEELNDLRRRNQRLSEQIDSESGTVHTNP